MTSITSIYIKLCSILGYFPLDALVRPYPGEIAQLGVKISTYMNYLQISHTPLLYLPPYQV
jgi:hypothetical protein